MSYKPATNPSTELALSAESVLCTAARTAVREGSVNAIIPLASSPGEPSANAAILPAKSTGYVPPWMRRKALVVAKIEDNPNSILLENIVVDVSVLDAVRAWGGATPDHMETCDDELLPLARMACMMNDEHGSDRLPISVERCGSKYKVSNGRHRLARAIIKGYVSIDIVPNSGRSDFVKGGGESNPGPGAEPRVVRADEASRGVADDGALLAADSVVGRPNAKRNTKPNKRDGRAENQQHDKVMRIRQPDRIAAGINEFKATKWYTLGISKGFASKAALDRFNQAVQARGAGVDPNAAPVCTHCGASDLVLCDCFIVAAPNAVQLVDDALVLPAGDANVKYDFRWVGGLRRLFTWPKYNSALPINHDIGWMSNSQLPEEGMLWEDMAAYLRMHMNTSYMLNGAFDRKAKLSHAKKLALRFLDEFKITKTQRLEPKLVASMLFTVQRMTDQVDDDFLLAQSSQDYNITSRLQGFMSNALTKRSFWIVVAIASPVLASKLVLASMRVNLWIFERLTQANARILVGGSVLALRTGVSTVSTMLRVFADGIWNGLVKPCCIVTLRLLCNTARTTSMIVSSTGSSSLRPIRGLWTGVSSVVSSTDWSAEWCRITSHSMRLISS